MISIKQLEKYCSGDFTKIENYEEAVNDPEVMWHCHHRLEEQGYSAKELMEMKRYYKVPPEELKLMTPAEHMKLHNAGEKSPTKRPEVREKISENNGSRRPEVREKASEARRSKRPVICIESGKIWKYPRACSKDLAKENGIKELNIVRVINGSGEYRGRHYRFLTPDEIDQLGLEL